MKSSNNKHKINLYTYYTFPKGKKKKYACENNERKQIVKHIESQTMKYLIKHKSYIRDIATSLLKNETILLNFCLHIL